VEKVFSTSRRKSRGLANVPRPGVHRHRLELDLSIRKRFHCYLDGIQDHRERGLPVLHVLASTRRSRHAEEFAVSGKITIAACDGEASQRSTAKMLGVDETTVRRDLGTKAAANAALTPETTAETQELETEGAANAAPEWFQDDVDPAKLANRPGRTRPPGPAVFPSECQQPFRL